MAKESSRTISFANWLITLVLSVIPGVNIIFFVITLTFARHPAKKSFAVAALVLTLVILIALSMAIILFGEEIARWLTDILEQPAQPEAL